MILIVRICSVVPAIQINLLQAAVQRVSGPPLLELQIPEGLLEEQGD